MEAPYTLVCHLIKSIVQLFSFSEVVSFYAHHCRRGLFESIEYRTYAYMYVYLYAYNKLIRNSYKQCL